MLEVQPKDNRSYHKHQKTQDITSMARLPMALHNTLTPE